MEDEEDMNDFAHEFMSMQNGLFPMAECFGGPVDGSELPVPVQELGVIVSGYNHNTGDMMHYKLAQRADDDTGEVKFVYLFMECQHAPDISFDEFMQESMEFDERHNPEKYQDEEDE